MNDRAKRRLGVARNLWRSVPPSSWGELACLLSPIPSVARHLVECPYRRIGHRDSLPVRLVRRFNWANRVLLKVEPRERVSDSASVVQRIGLLLLELQTVAVRNYFRVLTAHMMLERGIRRGRRDVAELISRELERERSRLARDLHSGAGQALAGIRLNLELIHSQLPDPPEPIRQSLGRIQFLTDEASGELRFIANRLHPPEWQRFTLKLALERLWVASGIPDRFRGTIRVSEIEPEPPNTIRIAIYRACQEALANVMRHSQATQVCVCLEKSAGRIVLTVDDNGQGIVESSRQRVGGLMREGVGLRAMREHAESLGGHCLVQSGSRGTRLEFSLPLLEES